MSVPPAAAAAAAAAAPEVPAAGSGGVCDSGSDDVDAVLDAVRRLYEEPRYQDVHFLCLDGRTVSSNRAFLAARCRYFEALLFGSLMEAHASEIRLQASSEAVRHVLMFLHTGGYGSIEAEGCWITLMEASSLAQQYMLPGMVKHVADRLSADLRPENLGVALSYALKADLQAVIKSIWTALPRLLTRPFALDRSFSADAICFCLNHTAWMVAPAAAGGSSAAACGAHSISSGGHAVAAAAAAAPAEANGTAMHRATSINGASTGSSSMAHAEGAVVSSRGAAGCKADSSVAQEAQALKAVIAWMLAEVADCAECRCSRHEVRSSASHGSIPAPAHAAALVGGGQPDQQLQHGLQDGSSSSSSSAGAGAAVLQLVGRSSRPPSGVAAAAGGSSRTAGAAGIDRTSSTASLVGESSVPHPAMLPSSRSSSRQQQQAADATRAGTSAAAMRRLSSRGSAALSASLDSEASEGGLLSQEASQTLALDTAGVFAVLTVTSPTPGAADASAAAATDGSNSNSAGVSSAALPPAADGEQQGEADEPRFVGCCCEAHEAMLLRMLAHLSWHLLEPSVLERLDSLALLGPAAMLELYRAHQRCSHMALWGNFPSLSLGGERGMRCFNSGGEQVLECESVSHLTADANLCFTSGKHCWQFVIAVPCDLVWLGVSSGGLQPDVWGGKQPGGWFYGSNDALCHNKQSDRHAYTKHCGNGKWGDGAVIDVCLDMDVREVWFGLDGGEPRLGFTDLPDKVYPAVSLRAPAQLLVRFRTAAEWRKA